MIFFRFFRSKKCISFITCKVRRPFSRCYPVWWVNLPSAPGLMLELRLGRSDSLYRDMTCWRLCSCSRLKSPPMMNTAFLYFFLMSVNSSFTMFRYSSLVLSGGFADVDCSCDQLDILTLLYVCHFKIFLHCNKYTSMRIIRSVDHAYVQCIPMMGKRSKVMGCLLKARFLYPR